MKLYLDKGIKVGYERDYDYDKDITLNHALTCHNGLMTNTPFGDCIYSKGLLTNEQCHDCGCRKLLPWVIYTAARLEVYQEGMASYILGLTTIKRVTLSYTNITFLHRLQFKHVEKYDVAFISM